VRFSGTAVSRLNLRRFIALMRIRCAQSPANSKKVFSFLALTSFCETRILRALNTHNTKPTNKTATNLSLSKSARTKGNRLKEILHRPSLSNVIEFLIEQKADELNLGSTSRKAAAK